MNRKSFAQVRKEGCFFVHPKTESKCLLVSVETPPGGLNQGRLLYFDYASQTLNREFFHEKFFYLPPDHQQNEDFFTEYDGYETISNDIWEISDYNDIKIIDITVPRFFMPHLKDCVATWDDRFRCDSYYHFKTFLYHIYEYVPAQWDPLKLSAFGKIWEDWWLCYFGKINSESSRFPSGVETIIFAPNFMWAQLETTWMIENQQLQEIVIGRKINE